jgi:hypothetical protein
VRDVVGLYLHRPLKAMVLWNEKSRIQALDRTQPMLRLAAGIASVASLYDYVVGGGKY